MRRARVRGFRSSRSTLGGIVLRDFSAEQHDLRRVVEPHQKNDDGGGRAGGRFQALPADVPADGNLADVEQDRGSDGSRKDIAQAMSVSGNHLNSIANNAARMTSEATRLTASPMAAPLPPQDESAARAALTTRETTRRKPNPRMPANEIR